MNDCSPPYTLTLVVQSVLHNEYLIPATFLIHFLEQNHNIDWARLTALPAVCSFRLSASPITCGTLYIRIGTDT